MAEKRSFCIESLLGGEPPRLGSPAGGDRRGSPEEPVRPRPAPPPGLPLLGPPFYPYSLAPSLPGLLPPTFQPAGDGKAAQVPLDWLAARASMFYPRYADLTGECAPRWRSAAPARPALSRDRPGPLGMVQRKGN